MQAQDEMIELLEKAKKKCWTTDTKTGIQITGCKDIYDMLEEALAKLKEEPGQGEFTKEMREKYEYAIKNKLCVHISAYVKALNVIDRLGAENERLKDAIAKGFNEAAETLLNQLRAENKKLVEGQQARKIAGS